MPVARVQDRYSADTEISQRSVEYWMHIICDNIDIVPPEKIKFVERCEAVLEADRPLLEWEISELEHVYEKVMVAANLPGVKKHVDKKRRGLRYG